MQSVRKAVGRVVFSRWVHPPSGEASILAPHSGDYGHSFLYEEIFCRDSSDIDAIARLSTGHEGALLDLAGGAGRVSERLAQLGREVTLVDKSVTMLEAARRKRRRLEPRARSLLRVIPQDMSRLSLTRQFGAAFAVNNGFEHLPDERAVSVALRRVADHLVPGGTLYLDVHCAPFWSATSGWLTGEWRYGLDFRHESRRYRVWERTSQPSDGTVCWEHAVMSGWRKFTWLKTRLLWRDPQWWEAQIIEAGLSIVACWGNWSGDALDPAAHPKLILVARARA